MSEPREAMRNLDRSGRLIVRRLGVSPPLFSDAYHALLRSPWWKLGAWMLLGYFIVNCLFTALYLLGGDCIQGARAGNVLDTFSFSVQTLSTIGYGALLPQTPYAQVLVAIESLVGLMTFAVITGLTYAKFSVPVTRIVFSRCAVIANHDGERCLMFRMANERGNQILEARLRVIVARRQITSEREVFRQLLDLPLVRDETPLFALSWTAMHRITPDSPLHELGLAAMVDQELEIYVALVGTDELTTDTLHARHSYLPSDLRFDHRLADMLSRDEDGYPQIDHRRFHDTVPFDQPSVFAPNRLG